MRRLFYGVALLLSLALSVSCTEKQAGTTDVGYEEKELESIVFTNAELIYCGDAVGEGISDGFVVKL